MALGATSLVLALLAYKAWPYFEAAWKHGEAGHSAKVLPLPVAINKPPTFSPETTFTMKTAASESSAAPDEEAQKIWSEFEKTALGETLQTWSGQHQEIHCKPFRGTMWGLEADRQWSHLCATGEGPEEAHWSFYVFGLQEPLNPRLGQFDESSAALPEDGLKELQSALQSRLSARFGSGEDQTAKPLSQQAFSWPHLHWRNGDVEVQLFASEFDPQRRQGRLRLLAQHRTLLEALKNDERLKLVGAGTFWYDVGSEIDKQLAGELRGEFPNTAAMLMKQQPDPDPEKVREAFQKFQAQLKSAQATGQTGPRAAIIAVPPNYWKAEEFYDALLKLLTSSRTAPAERRPALLLAADRLAWRLPWVIKNDKSHGADWSAWRKQLAEWGVTYEHSEASSVEDSDGYTGGLLKRVWTEYGETQWGERAFLVLQRDGWDTSADCAAGSDAFRRVIQQGQEFQKKHASSPYLAEVELTMAQAYETWWSLSQAPSGEEDSDVEPANYQEGAEAARQKSIAAYERLLQAAPQSDAALYAQRVLPRLKLGVDTGQRRYYCTVGD